MSNSAKEQPEQLLAQAARELRQFVHDIEQREPITADEQKNIVPCFPQRKKASKFACELVRKLHQDYEETT
jgi:hypothetical protein